jgi:hypothetical protein
MQHLEPARKARCDGLEHRQAALIALDRHHPIGALEEKRPRQSTGARSYLDDRPPLEGASGPGDPPREIEVEDKILAQAFFGGEPYRPNDLPNWRQAIGGDGLFGHGAVTAARLAVRAAASSRASAKLEALARPFPAISKAVPWSGEVRMKGRPRVTLTPVSNPRVLMGISAWSWYMAITAS